MSILEVNNVSKSFGGVKANVDISMKVEKGKIFGLIGPNGSGKTTLFNSIAGTYPIDNGSIKFNEKEVSELPVPVIAKLGLLRTFQQTRIYGKLNCIENMLISHKGSDISLFTIFSKIPKNLTDKAENLLNFVGLYQKRKLRAGDLSFGQQKLLELAMALMNEPEMLLLDEPTAGINPTLINGIIDRLIKVNKEYGITLLVIEHNMKVIMNLAQKVFCLAHGQMLANGNPEEIRKDKISIAPEDSKLLDNPSKNIIKDFLDEFEKMTKINKENLEKTLNGLIAKHKTNFKGIGQPLRIVLTGSKFGPGIYDIILSLNKDIVIKRLKN